MDKYSWITFGILAAGALVFLITEFVMLGLKKRSGLITTVSKEMNMVPIYPHTVGWLVGHIMFFPWVRVDLPGWAIVVLGIAFGGLINLLLIGKWYNYRWAWLPLLAGYIHGSTFWPGG